MSFSARRDGDLMSISSQRIGAPIVVTSERLGQPIEFRCSIVCSFTWWDVLSCFGNGKWFGEKPWIGDEIWKSE